MKRFASLVLLLISAMSIGFAQAPTNDSVTSAVVVPNSVLTTNFIYQENTFNATVGPEDPFGTYINIPNQATVWFSFTPTQNMAISISTAGSNYDTALFLLEEIGQPTPYFVTFNDDYNGSLQARINLDASAGQTYYFMVATAYNAAANNLVFTVSHISPPANDEIANATPVTSLPYSVTEDTSGATTSDGDPFCFGNTGTVWFTFTATQDQLLLLNGENSDYGPSVSVWTGTPGNLAQLACGNSRAVFQAIAGTTYYLMVDDWNAFATGTLRLTLSEPPPPPPSFAFSVQITSGRVDPTTGAATFNGTISCNRVSTITLNAQMRQRVGTTAISSYLGGYWNCAPGTPAAFSTSVTPPYSYTASGLFHGRSSLLLRGGKTYIEGTAGGWSWDDGSYTSQTITQSVTLKSGK